MGNKKLSKVVSKMEKKRRLRNVARHMREMRKKYQNSAEVECHSEQDKTVESPSHLFDLVCVPMHSDKLAVVEQNKTTALCLDSDIGIVTSQIIPTNSYLESDEVVNEVSTATELYADSMILQKEPGKSCAYEVENYDKTECTVLSGRRIVDLQFFFDKMKIVAGHKSLFNCGLSTIQIVSEYKNGFFSRLSLVCMMCKKIFQIETVDRIINKEAVAGILSSGCGYAQIAQFTAAVDLPEIKEKKYIKVQDEVADEWENTAWTEMIKAAEIEREAAIKEGRTNKDGIAMIDVVVDGCWSRRSYQTNYAANSGCAAIIGRRTRKVLYMAVKNKYCCICQRNGETFRKHICYKNYDGTSTGMEATIIAEGFKRSVEMHNLIYQRFIADGDSSTYAKIIESRPYPNNTVEKINCRNHILRRFCNNFQKLTTDTRYPVKDRKLISKRKILSARKYICDAIKCNKVDKNYQSLHYDINNSVCHAFGKHSKCKEDICSQKDEMLTQLDVSSIWPRIQMLAANVASHSRSLIEDVDSNVVEQFNSVVEKMVGGKRINYSQRRSYQTRCAGAVISFNNSGRLLSTVHRNVHNNTPKRALKRYESRICRKRESNKVANRKKKRFNITAKSDVNYGENADQPDMDAEMFKLSKTTFLNNLKKTQQERTRILKETVLQSESAEWLELRRNLLTASNFGKVIKRRPTNSCRNMVKSMLYSTSIDHVSSIQHGRNHEAVALEQLSKLKNIKIKKCGLYIDQTIPFLGATPDGITDDNDTVVEVKCPIAPFKMGDIDTAIDEKKVHFWKKDKNGQVYINKKSDWYYQVQGQMHICKARKCLFAVWYGDNKFKIETLDRDDEFWKREMESKLVTFYMDCLLPELVDPRHPKKKSIRDPDYVKVRKRKVEEDIETDIGNECEAAINVYEAPVVKKRLNFVKM